MNTKDKLNIISGMLSESETLIASVGGHIVPARNGDFISNAFSTMTTQEWGNSDQPSEANDELVKNTYIGLTENNIHIAVLDTYHPDIVSDRITLPQNEISWEYAKKGFRNYLTVKFDGVRYEIVIPSRKEITHLKDQHDESERFMDFVLQKTKEQNPLWIRLMQS